MKNLRFLFVVCLGFIALSSCSYEDSETPPMPNSELQYLNVGVAIPETGLSSRAVDENMVNSIHIFMFDQSDGKCASAEHYDKTEITGPTPEAKGPIWSCEPVGTTKGDKYLVAGVNLSTSMIEKMKNLICKPDELVMFQHSIEELTAGSGGMVMFSSTAEPLKEDFFYDTPEEAKAGKKQTIVVDRSVAKMAVFKADDMKIEGGGEYKNLLFGWGNVNNEIAYIPRITVDGSVEYPDYDWASLSKYNPTPSIPFYTQGVTPDVFAYAQENLLPYTGTEVEDKLTYLRITGGYIPEKFSYLDGDAIAQTANASQTAATFYTLETTSSLVYYFETREEAAEVLSAAGTGRVPAMKTDVGDGGIRTYTGGTSNFNVLINRAAEGTEKHNIVRNTYYRITVNSIKAPGLPGEGTRGDGEQWVAFSIKVLDWIDVREGVDVE